MKLCLQKLTGNGDSLHRVSLKCFLQDPTQCYAQKDPQESFTADKNYQVYDLKNVKKKQKTKTELHNPG